MPSSSALLADCNIAHSSFDKALFNREAAILNQMNDLPRTHRPGYMAFLMEEFQISGAEPTVGAQTRDVKFASWVKYPFAFRDQPGGIVENMENAKTKYRLENIVFQRHIEGVGPQEMNGRIWCSRFLKAAFPDL